MYNVHARLPVVYVVVTIAKKGCMELSLKIKGRAINTNRVYFPSFHETEF